MTRHEKKRILEADMNALIAEFLGVREEQTTASSQPSLERWNELEIRARELLRTIAGKSLDIGRLFPDHYPYPYSTALLPNQEMQSMDVFKKRDLLEVQLNHLPPNAPAAIRERLEEELSKMKQMIEELPGWRMPLSPACMAIG